ncbi:MAG TPA: FtsW/RodA/SpoVE family cell cycle protein [Actinomycetota bacterium]|jgi:cell division protein FtsW (lipid II flippase)
MIEAQRGVDRARSGAQLALTIVAILLAVGAVVLVKLGVGGTGGSRLILFGALFVVGYVAGHIAIRKLAPGAEPAFFPAAGLLTGLGFAEIYRMTPGLAVDQSYWLAIALVAFVLTLFFIRDHRQLDGFTYTIGLLAVILLLLPVLPGLGATINGARVWITLGPLSFQPAEIGKILLAIFLASYLNRKKELLQMAPRRVGPFHLPQAKDLGPLLLAWGVAMAVLFLENDLGQSLLYFGLFVVMLWVATARPVYLLVGFVLFAAGAVFAYKTVSHVEERVAVWLHATSTRPCLANGDTIACVYGGGYQSAQGQFAMATGGIGGTGLGQGSPQDIPFASTDFIFAAIAEELGLIGSIGVLLLFGVLVGKGLKVAVEQEDGFGKLLAVGLTGILGIQAFIIVGGVTRVIPLTGVTLPFVSYGGSSLLANYILLALLVRISAGPAPSRRKPLLASPAEGPPAPPPADGAPQQPAGDAPATQVIR